jgi:hypothetical protein
MARFTTAALCLPAFLCASGCLTPWNTRFPQLLPRSLEYERRESEVQDPYPESDLGPETASRPRDYGQQRSEPQRARERSEASWLRQQYGQPPGVDSPDTGAAYPDAVRQ